MSTQKKLIDDVTAFTIGSFVVVAIAILSILAYAIHNKPPGSTHYKETAKLEDRLCK